MSFTEAATHRLLYRGALSLPDSHLLLDGLTFSAPSHSAGLNLLQNPLALALESMRGRQSLSFVRLEKLQDVWLDASGNVCMDIHPHALISRIYFENVFCLWSGGSVLLPDGRSEFGVRVALGDTTNSSGTTEVIIYARHSDRPLVFPSSSSSTPTPTQQIQTQLELHVARITPDPPPPSPRSRLPRPDDPTPRRPPLVLDRASGKRAKGVAERLEGAVKGTKSKRIKVGANGGEIILKGEVKLDGGVNGMIGSQEGVAKLGSGVRVNADAVFKVPPLPTRTQVGIGVVGSAGDSQDADVFGLRGKGKGKQVDQDDEMEKTNKLLVKRITVAQLSAQGISKTHPEFKELYGFVYRGSAFAMRTSTKTRWLDKGVVERVVGAHVSMYVSGEEERVGGVEHGRGKHNAPL